MPTAKFEAAIPARELLQMCSLERTRTVIGLVDITYRYKGTNYFIRNAAKK
jgi:hypothetical protein